MITEEVLKQFITAQNTIHSEAQQILDELHEIDPIDGYNYLCDIEIDEGTIEFKGYESYCGGTDYYDYTIPTDAVYSEESRRRLLERREQRKQKKIDAQNEKQQQQQAKKEQQELEQYNKLKLKFGETK